MDPFRRVLGFIRPHRQYLVLNILFNLLTVVFSLFSIGMIIPALQIIMGKEPSAMIDLNEQGLLSDLFNAFYQKMAELTSDRGQSGALAFVSGLVVVVFLLKNLTRYLALYSVAPLRNGVVRDIRNKLHEHILRLPMRYFQDSRRGDLVSRMTGDLKEVEGSLMNFIEVIFREPFMILGSLVVLVSMSGRLTLLVLIGLPIVSLIITWIGKSLKRSTGQAQERLGKLMSTADESIYGLRVLKAFTAEGRQHGRFKKDNEDHFRLMNRVLRKTDLASPISEVMGTSLMAVVIWFGGNEVLRSEHFGAEQFIAYILFFYQMITPAKTLSRANSFLQRGRAAGQRIFEVLDTPNPIMEAQGTKRIDKVASAVRFDAVDFSYEDDRPVLKQVAFDIPKGHTVALVGQSGSGKSTLAHLLARFYDVTGGSIQIDETDVREFELESLRGLMGMVTQDSVLFHGSVADNITLGKPDATDEEVIEAARIANAHDFIMELPQAYQTNIGDSGGKLSGGQRQRISIARAILKNPEILILDEATSALDTESEKLVQEALGRLMESRTSLIIAHRLSTIRFADEIIVLEEGTIAERGTHETLLEKEGVYAKLCAMQSFA